MSIRVARLEELGRALTFGYATAVAMWCLWWLTHHPAVDAPPAIAGPVILAALFAGMVWAGRGAPRPWVVGGIAGLVTSALSLLILGALLATPPESAQAPLPGTKGLSGAAAVRALGFLALGAVVGIVGGTVGRRFWPKTDATDRPWLPRFSIVACVSVLPLLLLGGAVTSTGSGMSVPGWPDSYGANMFLYPISLMSNPRVFLEHTHRLLGSLVGLTTLTLMIWTLCSGARPALKLWSVAAFVVVVVQGVVGGLRVTEGATFLAFAHGVASQLFLAMLVVIAAGMSLTREQARAAALHPRDRRRRAFAMAFQHATMVQLVFGAAYRHFNPEKGSYHALWSHVGFSVVVVCLALAAAFFLRARGPASEPFNRSLRRLGAWILAVVGVQFALGWVTLAVVLSGGPKPDAPTAAMLAEAGEIPVLRSVVATLHQANGAMVLALATIAVVLTRALTRGRAPAQPAS